ncbi:hypothetical protein QBC33DRAFT_31687 [Phialemonium atrogriseum]|uniref:K Homology domain-containing protein n=1 Tax=Phialemonium atrogriseum TaxID=1093897 RepID=A0AAJ0CCQ0_9PEZI|nr:uncharacterized protein QBC33DRAFT_31687 [Phialemonium atrogriseum]KAK1772852.1 hypothetical protein QBC33DRAFT_31687 [Phialemonium atrogriseum]
MANPAPDLESILAALAAQRPPNSTPAHSQGGHAAPAASYPPAAHNPYATQAPPYQAGPSAYGYPAPSSSGNFDLSSIKPVNSGTVTIADAIAQAKAFATKNGATPYEHSSPYPPTKEPRGPDSRQYGRSRSRSPPPRRDGFRDNFNPYRDERRDDRGHQPREYGNDRSVSPAIRGGRQGFSPRGVSGAPRERSPPRGGGGDDNTETMQIESSLVGLIIGRQGENLRRVEQDSHCRVQFVPASNPNDQFRICKITGPRGRRAEARAAINRIIEDSGMGAIARAGLDTGREHPRAPESVSVKEDEDCLQIMVPDRTVGLIIGRGGETIRDLQERSGCHINIVGENKSVNGLRPVNLIGPQPAAMHAKDLILEIVDSDSRNANQGGGGGGSGGGGGGGGRPPRNDNMRDGVGSGGGGGGGGGGPEKINDAIYVPSEAVGMIIGKGGETIREIQNNTGCKINVSQSSGPGEVEREIGLVGSRDAINRAKQVIEEKVEAVRAKNSGGGGFGGGRGRGQPRDYDSPNYGQPSNNSSAAQNLPPAVQAPPAGAGGAADPYAPYGGYQAYLALWYQALASQQAQGQGDAAKPPGTA